MVEITQGGESSVPTESIFSTVTASNESKVEADLTSASRENGSIIQSVPEGKPNEIPVTSPVFEAFIIVEIVMTALEVIIWIVAAIKINRWKKNYRNQMLMQLSVVRFIKRLVYLAIYFDKKDTERNSWDSVNTILLSLQIYIDFVIVILVFYFIKHMYDSLIVVLVKISEHNLWWVVTCSWVLPIPVSAVCTYVVVQNILDYWSLYLLTCCLFRWPLMLLGTISYLAILCKVLKDQIRKFARSLTIITFLMCLAINFYLLSKDVMELWCLEIFRSMLIIYISGFLMNFFILCFYVILFVMNFKCNMRPAESVPNFSISVDK